MEMGKKPHSCLSPSLQLTSLRKELESIEQQLQRTQRLIHIADPDGWYNPDKAGGSSSSAAKLAAAAAAAKAALEADRQRRAEAVAKQRAGWAAAQVGPGNICSTLL